MSSYSKRTFNWSEKEFSLKELAASYGRWLPFPVLVTCGCPQRKKPKASPSSDQVYWLHKVVTHRCVIVKNSRGNRLKIPENYEATVVPVTLNGIEGQTFPFHRVRTEVGFKYFKFSDPQHEVFTEDVQQVNDKLTVGELHVVDVCDEDMFLVHSVFMENLLVPPKRGLDNRAEHKVVPRGFKLLATYLPIKVSIAVSMKLAPDLIFFKTVADIKKIVDSYQHNYDVALKDATEIVLDTSQGDISAYMDLTEIPQLEKSAEESSQDALLRATLERVRAFYDKGELADEGPGSSELDCGQYLDTTACLELGRTSGGRRIPNVNRSEGEASRIENQLPSREVTQMTRTASSGSLKSTLPPPPGADKVSPSGTAKVSPLARFQMSELPRSQSLGSIIDRQIRPDVPLQHRLVSELKSKLTRNRSDQDLLQYVRQMSPQCSPRPQRLRIRSYDDVPKDVAELSVEDVTDCLLLLKLGRYAPRLRDNTVDGKLLTCLNENILKHDFDFSGDDAVKLMKFVRSGAKAE